MARVRGLSLARVASNGAEPLTQTLSQTRRDELSPEHEQAWAPLRPLDDEELKLTFRD